MRCPTCGAENPSTNKFCGGCGAALALVCNGCGSRNSPTNRFCGECGARLTAVARTTVPEPTASPSPETYTPKHLAEKILASRAGLEGERKQVTILFADVVGSTALIQGRDDEDAQCLLDAAVQRMVDAVHRYEGTVSRRMGDGLMAMFGAPVAHEDHAVRACYAALAMLEAARAYADEARRAHGAAIQIRVGLNSGGVIVRLISNDRHLDYTAMGETVHLASRMEQLATPDSILISPATRTLVEGFVEVQPLGPRDVKGFERPVEVYWLVGAGPARTRLQATSARGLTLFVGRDEEQAAVERALARSQAGQGQVVALIAEPGVGKSRLVWEATRSELASATRVLQTGAVSYGQTTTWLPVIDLLRAYFQIDSRDDHAVMREKVGAGLRALDPALEPAQSALLSLLDVPIEDAAWTQRDPAQRRRATHMAVQQLLLRESQRQPLLLVFEDLHWIDSETQALLDSLVESLPTAHILLLVNYRPEYTHGWGSKTYYTQLRLDPLGEHGAGALLDALLGSDPTVQSLTSLLIQRTVGTPLFLEESVRALVETGALAGERGAYRLTRPVAEIRVPATVQTVLAARIDRLPAEEKRLLQMGAVIGKDVPFVLLRGIAERPEAELQASLSRLQAAEMLYPTTLFPELELTFKHALTHDVAYDSLLQDRRKSLHARIVTAIEAEYGDRLDEHVERLAHHAYHGQLWGQAVTYARQAGQRAAARSAYREAATACEQALAALDRLPATRERLEQGIDLRFDLRNVLLPMGAINRCLQYLDEAERIATGLEDRRRLGWALSYKIRHLLSARGYVEAVEAGRRAVAIAAEANDFALQVAAGFFLGQAYSLQGDHREAVDSLRPIVASIDARAGPGQMMSVADRQRFGLIPIHVPMSRHILARSLGELGEFDEAFVLGQEAVEIVERDGDAFSLAVVINGRGWTLLVRGDVERAKPLLERALGLARANDLPHQVIWISAHLGAAHVIGREPSKALALLEEAVTMAAAIRAVDSFAWVSTWLGAACLAAGRVGDARAHVGAGLQYAIDHRQRHFQAEAIRMLGEVAAGDEPPAVSEAENCYREALVMTQEMGTRPLQAHCHLGLGKLYRRIGRHDEASAELAKAVVMLREMGMVFWLPEAERELAEASE